MALNTFLPNTIIESAKLNANFESLADGTEIADGAITPEKLLGGNGTSWVWETWTPAFTNLTVGNGTNLGFYTVIGKTVIAKFEFTFGSTSSMGTNPLITLPITAKSGFADSSISTSIRLQDTGTATMFGMIEYDSTTQGQLTRFSVSGANVGNASITATTPFTWTTTDKIQGFMVYEAA
jgi:hypothetical protein